MAQILTDDALDAIQREKYAGPAGAQRLSQVIVATLGEEHPDGQTVDGPITIRQPSATLPALVIEPFPDATVPAFTGGGGGGGGGLSPAEVVFPPPGADPAGLAPQFPVILYGRVVSGTGNSYSVACWITNPSVGAPLGNFTCVCDLIDPAETIPVGTPCLVWCAIAAGNILGGFRMFPISLFLA